MEIKPLNIFQRCIRVWEESHPYNAAQILHIAGDVDHSRLTTVWNEVLTASGLGNARVTGRHFAYELPVPQTVSIVDPEEGLDKFITREMNRPFAENPAISPCITMPFRPFVLPLAGSHYMGVMYQHWVADSISLRMLLREWFCRLHDPANATGKPVDVPRGGLWRYFGPRRTGWNVLGGTLALIRSAREFSKARKIEKINNDHRVECSIHRLPAGMIDTLLAAARKSGVTLNDFFMAALARACDLHGATPHRSEKDLAIGSIVDLRALSSEDLDNTFSLFLGFTANVISAEVLRDSDRLLETLAAQNVRQKERRAAAASVLRMAAGYAQGRLLSPQRLAAFYRNYMPVAGGLSNVNMNRAWPAKYHPAPLLDYIRVAPTGPMVPLVFAVTTMGRNFTFVLTRRVSLVSETQASALAQTFIEELTARAKSA